MEAATLKLQPVNLHKLNRTEQVILFRLRTGHNGLNAHMYNKFKVGESVMYPCNADIMTAEHLLQHCPIRDAMSHNETGHMAGTDASVGQGLWQPGAGGAEEVSRLREGNRHLHLAYDYEEGVQRLGHSFGEGRAWRRVKTYACTSNCQNILSRYKLVSKEIDTERGVRRKGGAMEFLTEAPSE